MLFIWLIVLIELVLYCFYPILKMQLKIKSRSEVMQDILRQQLNLGLTADYPVVRSS